MKVKPKEWRKGWKEKGRRNNVEGKERTVRMRNRRIHTEEGKGANIIWREKEGKGRVMYRREYTEEDEGG